MKDLKIIGREAEAASKELARLGITERNNALNKVADALIKSADYIKEANETDIVNGRKNGMSTALLDRLLLSDARIEGMADGLRVLAGLDDPIGEVKSMKTRPNGLMIGKKTVPLGVVAIIYESRPNVTADAFGLCFKSANACILRGGSDSVNSNIAIVNVITDVLKKEGINPAVISYITDTDRKYVDELMHMNEYVDVIIPRGGAGLIKAVVNNATVPVIETGVGNCHIYIDDEADINMGVDIIVNAKTSRPAVCNAAEKLLVNEKIAEEFLPVAIKALKEKGVEIRGCEKTKVIVNDINLATEEDWGKEYLDYILGVKIVKDLDEAISHINKYGTKHSESIVTKNYFNSEKFLQRVDAAAVYVNASTRFTDGGEFGFGAEIGISTQKLHARGPMGLKELTTNKYIIYGNGQVR